MKKMNTVMKKLVAIMFVICFNLMGISVAFAATKTTAGVRTEISKLEKEIKATEEKYNKVKKELDDAIYLYGASIISNNPFIVESKGIFGGTSYYWVNNPNDLDNSFIFVCGYIKSTGEYKSYNNVTCTVCNAISTDKIDSYEQLIDKKFEKVLKLKESLSAKVNFKNTSNNRIELAKGKSKKLAYTISGYPSYNQITWSSSDPSVVSVSKKGTITAKKGGTVTITAKTSLSHKTTKLKVVVTIPVTKLNLSQDEVHMMKDSTYKLDVAISPSNYSEKITWKTSNDSVVTVKNGVLKAKGIGKATIVASTGSGKKAACKVKVLDKVNKIEIPMSKLTVKLVKNQTYTSLPIKISPSKSKEFVKYKSSDQKVAEFSDGRIVLHKEGKVTLTAYTTKDIKASIVLTVSKSAEDDLNEAIAKHEGDIYKEKGIVIPEATNLFYRTGTYSQLVTSSDDLFYDCITTDDFKTKFNILDYEVSETKEGCVLWLQLDAQDYLGYDEYYDYDESEEDYSRVLWYPIVISKTGQ